MVMFIKVEFMTVENGGEPCQKRKNQNEDSGLQAFYKNFIPSLIHNLYLMVPS